MNKLVLGILFILLTVMVAPSFAQDAEETPEPLDTELIDLINNTLDRMAALEAYSVKGDFVVDQSVMAGTTTVDTNLTQEMTLQIAFNDGAVIRALLNLEQAIKVGQGIGEGTLVLDMVLPDGSPTFYVNLSKTTGLFLGLGTDGWEALESAGGDFVTEAFGDPDTLLSEFSQAIIYPINESTVLSVKEGRARTLRFRRQQYPTRQFNLELNPRALYEAGVLDRALQNMDAEALGLAQDDLIELVLDNSTFAIDLYYDEEADYFRQIETTFTFTATFAAGGQDVTITQTSKGQFQYTDYDVEFSVAVPSKDEPVAEVTEEAEAEDGE